MIAALRAAETKTERSGGAGRKGGWGEMNARPALASCPVANAERSASGVAAAEFRILLCKKRRQLKRCCPCPSRPYAGNDKELPKICLLKFILFGSIRIQIINLYTTILPKLYLYDKWKNNK
jgi:hypothetical protein